MIVSGISFYPKRPLSETTKSKCLVAAPLTAFSYKDVYFYFKSINNNNGNGKTN